jgi:hypothetical protein
MKNTNSSKSIFINILDKKFFLFILIELDLKFKIWIFI